MSTLTSDVSNIKLKNEVLKVRLIDNNIRLNQKVSWDKVEGYILRL